MQETEKPGVAVAQGCRRHGVATSMVLRWLVEFGLTARKAPQLATVELIHGTESESPAVTALRNLVQPPDGMIASQLDDGRRIFASVGSEADAAKRHLAARRPHHYRRPGGRVGASGARSCRHAQRGLDGLATVIQEQLKTDHFSGFQTHGPRRVRACRGGHRKRYRASE
ncbi:hypothetical protein NKI95_29795 [Mesorhizobium sp. M0306]